MATPGIKLLIWFVTLTLVISCVPSLPAPIPTLDPNAINVFIVQTANAASTQTVAAMPAFTLTATTTATPRNTFTPEPTITPFQTFILPSPTPNEKLIYFRVKHDSQLAIYNYKSRTGDKEWGGRDQTAEVVPLFVLPKLSSGTARTRLEGGWEILINALNNNDEAKLRYLKADNSGLFNTSGFPQLESLTMGGNIVTLDAIQGEWGRIDTLDYRDPPDFEKVNYITRPDLIHKFVVVVWRQDTKTTFWVNPPQGDLYWPLVTKDPVWIQMSRLEKFPDLPMVVTANTTLYIQRTPGPGNEPTDRQVEAGETAQVIEYYPSASNVWGRLQGGGWITLLWRTQYPTSWQMEAVPPP